MFSLPVVVMSAPARRSSLPAQLLTWVRTRRLCCSVLPCLPMRQTRQYSGSTKIRYSQKYKNQIIVLIVFAPLVNLRAYRPL